VIARDHLGVLNENTCCLRQRLVGLDCAISLDLDDQAIEVSDLADSRVLDDVVNLLDRREQGVDRDLTDCERLLELSLLVATPDIKFENRSKVFHL